ncbi:MAG TPA: hypothetical protein VM915_09100 [Verrucomicrobiae bacterium]|nr:hypothetical protein [Verrucomicrobiae bacterium]
MRFSIEYLRETTDEYSVCCSHDVDVMDLCLARTEAWRHIAFTRNLGATGFQIRNAALNVVAIEEYDNLIESPTIH